MYLNKLADNLGSLPFDVFLSILLEAKLNLSPNAYKGGKSSLDNYRHKIPARGFAQFSISRLLPWQLHVIIYYERQDVGVKRNLVAHLNGVQMVGGSNPLIPMSYSKYLLDEEKASLHPDSTS
jgi:hypothetical protein